MRKGMICILALLTAAGLLILFAPRAGGEKRIEKHGYTLVSHARGGGEKILFDRRDMLSGLLMLISPEHPMPADTRAPSTRALRATVGRYIGAEEGVLLEEECIYALCELYAARSLKEVKLVRGASAPEELRVAQREGYERCAAVMNVEEALARAKSDWPLAGETEHSLGYCFDLELLAVPDYGKTDPLARTEEGEWLARNAWRFGFIRRYPPEKSAVTGVLGEGTHLRYVGRAHAIAMEITGMCLEEYLAFLHETGGLTIARGDEILYEIRCVKGGEESAAFLLPEGYAALCVSLDNLGYCVLAAAYQSAS